MPVPGHVKRKSIYRRTMLAAFASVMVAFTVLSLVYYGVVNERVYRLQLDRIRSVSVALRRNIEHALNSHEEQTVQIGEKINLMAKASNTYIWLIRNDGIIIHASELPDTVLARCRQLPGGMVQMPIHLVGDRELPDTGIILQNSDFAKLFNKRDINWISVLLPVRLSSGSQKAILQVHLPFVDQYNWKWFFTNGVGVAFLVGLVISVALTLILMNYLTRPLEALAQAAHQVTLGDYSVRVKYSDLDRIQGVEDLADADEISKLLVTFNVMAARLEAVNAEQRDMISCLSHDMKTPLTSIIGFSEGILDGTVPEDKQERYLQIIRQEALRLKNLLADLSEEQLIENRGTQNFSDFDFQAVLDRTILSLENQLQAKSLEVEFPHLMDKLWVTGDEEQIARVVYNLLSNATKFCPESARIRCTTEFLPGSLYIRCRIEDSGPGIPVENRNKVFGRFYKLDRSRGNREGSGLGLYICRKILAQHGQQIYVTQSQDLGGACFVFTLPAAKMNEKPPSKIAHRPVGAVNESTHRSERKQRGEKTDAEKGESQTDS